MLQRLVLSRSFLAFLLRRRFRASPSIAKSDQVAAFEVVLTWFSGHHLPVFFDVRPIPVVHFDSQTICARINALLPILFVLGLLYLANRLCAALFRVFQIQRALLHHQMPIIAVIVLLNEAELQQFVVWNIAVLLFPLQSNFGSFRGSVRYLDIRSNRLPQRRRSIQD